MNKKTKSEKFDLTRVTRTIYFFIAVIALSIIMFDSGNLITKEAIVQRWSWLTTVLVVNTFAWSVTAQNKSETFKKTVTLILAVTLLAFAGFMTYWERGMASTSTILYVLPLLVVATLKNRHALLATAALLASTYALASVKYFNDFFNEGYRIQLWGNIVQYVGIIFVSTWLIMIIVNLRHDSK